MNPLPRLMLISARAEMQPSFEGALENALRGGALLIQLRERDLPLDEFNALALRAAHLCRHFGARLLINGEPEIARAVAETGCDCGIHRKTRDACLPNELAGGASVHSVEEARCAQDSGAQYLVFGSVFATESHSGAIPAGLKSLRAVCESVTLPVFAVGGINKTRVKVCLENGAHGVAVIRAIWRKPDVEEATRELMRSLAN